MTAAGTTRRRRGERTAAAMPGDRGAVTRESLARPLAATSTGIGAAPRGAAGPPNAREERGCAQAGTGVRPPSRNVLSPDTMNVIPSPKLSACAELRFSPLVVTGSLVA